jgi:hypothetical protein
MNTRLRMLPHGFFAGLLLALLLMAPLFLAIVIDVASNDDPQRIAAKASPDTQP